MQSKKIIIERDVPIRMRDNTVLRADIYRPETDIRQPAILCRLPYNKVDPLMHLEGVLPFRAIDSGFAIVYQDTRGRYQSDGAFYPFIYEGQDGYDTVEWVASQPWCSGAVGMTGASYFGATQWLSAIQQPPHLKAICPVVTASEYYQGWTYQGGAFQLGFILIWTLTGLSPDTAKRLAEDESAGLKEMTRLLEEGDRIWEHYRHLPLNNLPILYNMDAARYYDDWLTHFENDDYWQAIAVNRRYNQISVPAFNIGGWYDLFLHGTFENFTGMREGGGSKEARDGQQLLVGPWAHANFSGSYPETNFGLWGSWDGAEVVDRQLDFFRRYLLDEGAGSQDEPPVRLYVMGTNRWRDEYEWPLKRAKPIPWYLHSDGQAAGTGGTLSPVPPSIEEVDVYLYDPRDPVPTRGGATFLPGFRQSSCSGPMDQRPVESRPDVLCFTSEIMDEPLEVTGPLTVKLWAATQGSDTDFVARLCDVFPDGTARILADGILRAAFRNGFERYQPVKSGEVVEYSIDLVATSNVFMPGHRIRVDITSSCWPRFDVNSNSGHPTGQAGYADLIPVLQTILHDADHPSHILLPVIV
jgi:putative CocE/NonD family hydrolase